MMDAIDNDNERIQPISDEKIQDLILTIRDKQVLLDSDVARLYGYETKAINQAASRNSKRFPPEFRFQLTDEENETLYLSKILRSQIVTANKKSRTLPFAYTEQGIGMLSGILKNDTAVQVSIGIMNAFVEMRKVLTANRYLFERIADMDNKLIEHDHKLLAQDTRIEEILSLLNAPETNKQWIFYKGQFYDAFSLALDIIKQAKFSITVIDNYINDSVLELFTQKRSGVSVTIITFKRSRLTPLHLKKFSAQYGSVTVVESNDFHDRFIIIDDNDVYALGASIKDLGKKCFEISKNEDAERFVAYVASIISSSSGEED